ncbi:hypothetical protein CSC94_02225 [Zhengella mangrovi]|uniref:TRAP transporter small permease protein n=1 Tax=Zhengella mangrovi TaxID=1982044 RepID=A0A2G1QTM9_9HYPH|nr:TRAP transporter small permease [Zhengella mangrovi]PHP68831.1 hypothetical protein CSC94_02225 [Zhengella mangrovi]
MSSHNVREDGSAASRADRALFKLESGLNLVAGLTILGVMLLSVANILMRKFFNWPVPGYIDWMISAVPLMAFFGVSFTQRLGGHIRMDLLVSKFSGRSLWIAEFIGVLGILLITLILIYGSWDHAMRALNFGDSTGDIRLPTWPVKIVVPICLSILALRLVLQLWAYGRAIGSGEAEPVAVPLIEDAATQAAHEAETVSGLDDEATR